MTLTVATRKRPRPGRLQKRTRRSILGEKSREKPRQPARTCTGSAGSKVRAYEIVIRTARLGCGLTKLAGLGSQV